LAHITDNQTYAEEASKMFDALTKIGFVTDEFDVYDGAHVDDECSDANKAQFSLPAALLIQGAAYLFNKVRYD
jgi:mannan endo-1,6-alpha-mannosidase